MLRSSQPDDVVVLVDAYERLVGEATDVALIAEREATKHSYGMYYRFRDKVREAETLQVLIEGRFAAMAPGQRERIEARYVRLGASALAMQVRASLRFFFVLSANTFMPLGSREIFLSELARLDRTHAALTSGRFGPVDGSLLSDIENAREILTEIADKAPSLLDLARSRD